MVHRESLRQRWRKTTVANQAMVISTVFVAFGTLCLTVAAVFQYLTAREQSKIARDSMIASNRPYVDVSVIDEPSRLEADHPVRVTLQFANGGT